MFKRRMLAATAVAVLALGLLGGAVFAHDRGGDGEGEGRGGAFITRVAEILGLEEATVQEAVEQAREELADEHIRARLDAAVADGLMTQEEADALLERHEARPDDAPASRGHGHRGHRGFGQMGGHGFPRLMPDAPADDVPTGDQTAA